MREKNARIAQLLRESVESVLSLLQGEERSRFQTTVEQKLYPEVYGREDSVQAMINARQLNNHPDIQNTVRLYDRARRRIEQNMVERIIRYRDQWLALNGNPMDYNAMFEYDNDMKRLNEKLSELESRYSAIIHSLIGDSRNEK